MTEGIGDRFQKETKYQRDELPGGYLRWDLKPETFKKYPLVPHITLPPPEEGGGMPIWKTLFQRQSVRSFKNQTLSL